MSIDMVSILNSCLLYTSLVSVSFQGAYTFRAWVAHKLMDDWLGIDEFQQQATLWDSRGTIWDIVGGTCSLTLNVGRGVEPVASGSWCTGGGREGVSLHYLPRRLVSLQCLGIT